MTTAAYPAAIPALNDVPSLMSIAPLHSANHNQERAEIVAIATALGAGANFTGIKRYASIAARDSDASSTGKVAYVTANSTLYVRAGTVWRTLWAPWVEVTSGFVPSPGWSTDYFYAITNGLEMQFSVSVTRSGGTIISPDNGNISNVQLGALPTSCRGTVNMPLSCPSLERMMSATYQPIDGSLTLTAFPTNIGLINGETARFSGTFIISLP